MILTVIGVGLIGGSMAIDLKKRGFVSKVIGVDNSKLHINTAHQIGLIDEIDTFEEGIAKADIVLVATPVDVTIKILPKIMDLIDNQVVTDVCSTKAKVIESIRNHPKRGNFVAAHPMSGTEFSGPWAAIPNLFDGKALILCDIEDSDKKAVYIITKMFETMNMRFIYMNSADHDVHAAYVSHISHISSFALALTVLEKEKDEKNIFDLASGGFDSTVRLAKSSPEMWTPIFVQNDENVLTVLDTYIQKLILFKEAITQKDDQKVKDLIVEANRIKRILSKKI